MSPIKCISLWQPYASLVVMGEKQFETRSWSTNYRGTLLIHAAKKPMGSDAVRLLSANLVKSCSFPLGAIVGVVRLTHVWRITSDSLERGSNLGCTLTKPLPCVHEHAFGDYTPGRYAWQLESPVKFELPIPFRGMQQLFNVPSELLSYSDFPPAPPEPSTAGGAK